MSTTDLFVELIVIGIGAVVWVALLLLSFFGYAWVDPQILFSLPALIPFLALTYILGIIMDRVADTIFEQVWGRKIFNQFYDNTLDFYNDRRLIYVHAERLAELMEYGRSRLRISRGSAVNAILILISFNTFIWTQISNLSLRWPISIFGSLFWLLLAAGAWFTWYKLNINAYRSTKGQSAFLRATILSETTNE